MDSACYPYSLFRPTASNEGFISLGGWCFDISSIINKDATNEEIIEGWNLINNKDDKFVLDRMFQIFFRQLVINATGIPIAQFSKSSYYSRPTMSRIFEQIHHIS